MSADWIKTAKVGDKVVCIDDCPWRGIHNNKLDCLEAGRVYTIQWVGTYEWEFYNHSGIGIRVLEIQDRDDCNTPFSACRFRPVHPRKTDISIFTDMLKTEPVREDA